MTDETIEPTMPETPEESPIAPAPEFEEETPAEETPAETTPEAPAETTPEAPAEETPEEPAAF